MLSLTVSSQGGYAGNVPVTATVVDGSGTAITGWTLTPTPASVDLTAGSSATVALLVKIPTDAAVLTPTVKVSTGGANVASTFTIANQLTITIAEGTGTTPPHTNLPAPNAPIKVRMGAKVIFHNADTVPHEIHAGGGIPHEGGPLNPGADYVTTPTGDATWYCHAHEGNSNISRLINVE